jgi:protein gp37
MTKIEWTDFTWNPWWGCSEIAPECGMHAPTGEHGLCYAAVFASRNIHEQHRGAAQNGEWTGRFTRSGEKVWQAPFKWPVGKLVFTCSMSDFWHQDVPLNWLDEALDVIRRTPHLTYQVLSKRPGNIARKLAALRTDLPSNIWLGLTLGHQKSAPLIRPFIYLEADNLRFLSCEPLMTELPQFNFEHVIHWVIGGGQSGRGDLARTDPDWMRKLRDNCIEDGVPFFLKQWGNWQSNPTPREQELDPAAKGGATLDGRLWREFPERGQ